MHAQNADGTSSIQTFEGGSMRAQGQLSVTPPYDAWIHDGRVVDEGPNLPISSLTVEEPGDARGTLRSSFPQGLGGTRALYCANAVAFSTIPALRFR